jgi:hypothetical protein
MSSWQSRKSGKGELLPHHKRSRGGSTRHCDASTAHVPSEDDIKPIVKSNPPVLAGLVWDEAKQRYFRPLPSHSHMQHAARTSPSTTVSVDIEALENPCSQKMQSSGIAESLRSACARPFAYQSSPVLPMMRECVGGVGRPPLPTGSFHWSLAKRQLVQNCKHAAYFSRSIVLFSEQSVSLLHVPPGVLAAGSEAPAPMNQVLQLPSTHLSTSAVNVTAGFHSYEKYSWLNPGTCIHVAVAAQHSQHAAAAAAITTIQCRPGQSGMIPSSVQSSSLLGARHPCSWLGRGSSHPTLDCLSPICYVAGGRGGQHVAALALDQAMASSTAPEWKMPNGMSVSCMSMWAGCGAHDRYVFCGGSSCDAVSIDPRSSRIVVHHGIRHVTQCGWPGGCQMVCGHVGGSVCVWDMRFTKNAISTTAPQKEVFSLWSLSVSANAALALFTKHDSATFIDINTFRVKKFDTQVADVREGQLEVVSRIGSQGEGCAVFDDAFVAWDAHHAWAWQSRFR